MIDTHIHADARTGEDFNEMYLSGIDVAVTCAYYPYKIDNDYNNLTPDAYTIYIII